MVHRSGEWDRALKHAIERMKWHKEHGNVKMAQAIKEELDAYDCGDRTDILLGSLRGWK